MTPPILIDLPLPIRTPRLTLRHYREGDGICLNEATRESLKELSDWLPWVEHPPSLEESETYARKSHAKWILREDLVLPLFEHSSKTLLGAVGLHRPDWSIPRMEIGYWIRSSMLNKGYVTEAVNALTRYAFAVLQLKRIEIRCDSDNIRSAKVAERLGFSLEGKFRQNTQKPRQTGLADTLIYARTDLVGLPELEVHWNT